MNFYPQPRQSGKGERTFFFNILYVCRVPPEGLAQIKGKSYYTKRSRLMKCLSISKPPIKKNPHKCTQFFGFSIIPEIVSLTTKNSHHNSQDRRPEKDFLPTGRKESMGVISKAKLFLNEKCGDFT